MAKRSAYKCSNCGEVFSRWAGFCPNCKEAGTLDEVDASVLQTTQAPTTKAGSRADRVSTGDSPEAITSIGADRYTRITTGIGELDRVLGGGLVPGGVVLLAGSPGAGKSSLTLSAANSLATQGKKVLIASGEETKGQIKSRADRINANSENLYLLSEGNLNNVIGHIGTLKPDVVVIDSVQTLVSDNSESRVGSVSQMAEVAQQLTQVGKTLNIPLIMIGHVTKDGNIAGPRVVEHLVDVVLYLEDAQDTPLRLLRGIKNRYGATDEVGCFQHEEDGLQEVSDPSGYFLSEHAEGVVGFATSIIVEGNRALPIEVQALVTPTGMPNPRRVNHGLDNARVLMVQAILEKHGGLRLQNKDIYVSTTGGLVTKDTSIDLAIAAAICSSYYNHPSPNMSVFLGEATLTGEVRPPRASKKRTAEADRLGFKNILSPLAEDNSRVRQIYQLVNHFKNQSGD